MSPLLCQLSYSAHNEGHTVGYARTPVNAGSKDSCVPAVIASAGDRGGATLTIAAKTIDGTPIRNNHLQPLGGSESVVSMFLFFIADILSSSPIHGPLRCAFRHPLPDDVGRGGVFIGTAKQTDSPVGGFFFAPSHSTHSLSRPPPVARADYPDSTPRSSCFSTAIAFRRTIFI